MVKAYNNSVCVFIECDGFEFPVTVENAQKLIQELQQCISNVSSTETTKDEK